MINITLPSICNLPLQNLSIINLPPIQLTKKSDKLFYCNDCPKTFNRKNSLIRHIRVHYGYRPYTCKVCNKGFSRKDILARHKESLKCIRRTQVYNSRQIANSSLSEMESSTVSSPSLIQSKMSISSLVSDNSDLISEEEDHYYSNSYNIYSIMPTQSSLEPKIDSNQLNWY